MPSNPRLSIEETEQDTWVQAQFQTTGDSVAFDFRGQGANAFVRWLGCAIMTMMPDEGLEEALTSLKEIFEYNIENARYTALPAVESKALRVAKVVSTSMRPDLVISE